MRSLRVQPGTYVLSVHTARLEWLRWCRLISVSVFAFLLGLLRRRCFFSVLELVGQESLQLFALSFSIFIPVHVIGKLALLNLVLIRSHTLVTQVSARQTLVKLCQCSKQCRVRTFEWVAVVAG